VKSMKHFEGGTSYKSFGTSDVVDDQHFIAFVVKT
jgi:hypothetical protein